MSKLVSIFFLLVTGLGFAKQPPTAQIDPVKAAQSCEGENNLSACLRLGVYEERRGKFERAKKYLAKACNGGDVTSCMHLGRRAKIENNPRQALHWFKKECRLPASRGVGCAAAADLASRQKSDANAKLWNAKACTRGQQDRCTD